MKRMGMTPGKGSNTDRRITLARRAKTMQGTKYSISGRERKVGVPRPVTLPKLAFLNRKEPE